MGGPGSGGHNRKTLAQHLRDGTYNATRHGPLPELLHGGGSSDAGDAPPMPNWLSKRGQRRWHELVDELAQAGVLAITDRAAMAVHCQTWAEWQSCLEVINKRGSFEKKRRKHGTVTLERPESVKAKKLVPDLEKQLGSFGLMPARRVKVPEKPAEKTSPLKRYQA